MNPRTLLTIWALAAATAAFAAPPKKPAPPPAGVVTGRVLLPTGKPAAGARVWVGWLAGEHQGFTEGRADAAGVFRIAPAQKAAEAFWFGGAASGAAPGWTALRDEPGTLGAVKPLTLKLPAPITITGYLVDGAGKPKPGVTIRIPKLASANESSVFGRMGAAMAPTAALAGLKTQSGPDGAFRIAGLPPGQITYLELPEPMLSPENWIQLGRGPVQAVGIVPAVRTGSLQIVAQSRGEPAAGATAWIRRGLAAPEGELAAALGRSLREARAEVRKIELEANGLGLVEDLRPGRYEVAFHGRSVAVEVPDGDAAPPVKLDVRALSGSGVVRDGGGKPVVGARVSVQIGDPVVAWPPGPANAVVTDERGAWTVEDFPWEAPLVVVRAQTPDASAEWKGSPASLRAPLALTLKAGTLLTVKGRLVWSGKPLSGAPIAVFTREGAHAQALAVGKTDREGRFELGGVRRGVRFALGSVTGNRPYESAFHVSPESGDELDLGDVALRPQLSLGAAPGTPEWAELFWPAALPSDADRERARDAGFRFLEALRKGDAAAAHALLSRLSHFYEPELRSFLSEGGFGLQVMVPGPAALGKADLFPVRISPRGLLAARLGEETSPEERQRVVEALDRPDWVAMTYGNAEGVHGLFLMHRDADGWKVLDGIETGSTGQFVPAGDKLLAMPAPAAPPESLSAAREFLTALGQNDLPAMRARTARDAREWAAADDAYRAAWTARPRAMKPAPAGAQPEPMLGLSAWDLLTLYVNSLVIGDYRPGQFGKDPEPAARSAADRIRAGRLAAARFTAGGREYLMLLSREEAGWKVVEPALPLGGPRE